MFPQSRVARSFTLFVVTSMAFSAPLYSQAPIAFVDRVTTNSIDIAILNRATEYTLAIAVLDNAPWVSTRIRISSPPCFGADVEVLNSPSPGVAPYEIALLNNVTRNSIDVVLLDRVTPDSIDLAIDNSPDANWNFCFPRGFRVGKRHVAAIYAALGYLVYLAEDAPPVADSVPVSPTVFSGTGWITDSGYIVTANHVINDADRISVVLPDGQTYDATVAVADEVNDVAVLSVGPEFPRAGGLRLTSVNARPAASVLAMGYPLPSVMGSSLKVTTGTISSAYGFQNDPRTYQFSAQIQSGNSGGPLLNLQGEVIGVVTEKLNAATVFQWTGVLPEGVSYAVKSAYLQPLLDSLPKMGVRFDWRADMIMPDSSAEEIAAQATPFVVMVIGSKR